MFEVDHLVAFPRYCLRYTDSLSPIDDDQTNNPKLSYLYHLFLSKNQQDNASLNYVSFWVLLLNLYIGEAIPYVLLFPIYCNILRFLKVIESSNKLVSNSFILLISEVIPRLIVVL